MISHKHRFIFIEVPKTGTTTICSVLSSNCDAVQPCKHLSIKKYKEKFSKETSSYFKFAFVRNPWDRALSLYKYIVKTPKHYYHKQCLQFVNFSAYLRERPLLPQQYDFLSKHGKNQLNFIGKLENLQADFDIVCDKIGIPQQQLPHHNKTKHKHYTEYYDDETRQIVAEKYAKDIEYFNYKFGE